MARLGFAEPERSAGLLRDAVLLRLFAPGGDPGAGATLDTDALIESTRAVRTSVAEGLASAADPDLAALGLVRLVEAVLGMPPRTPATHALSLRFSAPTPSGADGCC